MSQSPQAGQFNSYEWEAMSDFEKELESQSPQAGQFNSYGLKCCNGSVFKVKSQSPQAGQFNSYKAINLFLKLKLLAMVSIPSSGSIQFLP